jgi:hypothetical protein
VGAALIDRDSGQPGGDGRVAAKAFQARQGDEEDVLDDVLDGRPIPPPEQAMGEPGDLRLVAGDDGVEVADVVAWVSQSRVLCPGLKSGVSSTCQTLH